MTEPATQPTYKALLRERRRAWLRWWAAELGADGILLGGAAAIVFGVWHVSPPAAYIVGGIFAMATGLLLQRGRTRKDGET